MIEIKGKRGYVVKYRITEYEEMLKVKEKYEKLFKARGYNVIYFSTNEDILEYDNKLFKMSGLAGTISYEKNVVMVNEYSLSQICDTLMHEYVHLLLRLIYPYNSSKHLKVFRLIYSALSFKEGIEPSHYQEIWNKKHTLFPKFILRDKP